MPEDTITPPTHRRTDVSLDLASVEAALRQIVPADIEERLLAQIPQWFLVTKMLKDLELAYTRLENRSKIEPKYRAVLTAILSLGENISAALMDRPGLDLKAIGYCPTVVDANLRYLRGKYRQWFFPRDAGAMEKLLKVINSEGEPGI